MISSIDTITSMIFPIWIIGHFLFSIYLLKKALQSYKTKTFLPKFLHISFFVIAFVASTVSMLYLIDHQHAPYWTVVAAVGFALNALIGIFMIPFIHYHWVVWKRLILIGALFNILTACITVVLMFPSNAYANEFLLVFQLTTAFLSFVIISELTLFVFDTFFPSKFFSSVLPKIENDWMFPFNYFHIFFCQGELPWKNFGISILFVRLILIATLYFSSQWLQINMQSIHQMSENARHTAVMVAITSVWANALSVFAPTMMYRGIMSRAPAVLIYVIFAFPMPQLSSLWIVMHPTHLQGSFSEKAAELLYAASYGYLPPPPSPN